MVVYLELILVLMLEIWHWFNKTKIQAEKEVFVNYIKDKYGTWIKEEYLKKCL